MKDNFYWEKPQILKCDFKDFATVWGKIEKQAQGENEKREKEKFEKLDMFIGELLYKYDLHVRGCHPDNKKLYRYCHKTRRQMQKDIIKYVGEVFQ